MTPPHIKGANLDTARHGFFGCKGGVSSGIYSSLNCGLGSDDEPGAVASNRGRVCQALDARHLQTCHQIHSADAVFVNEPVTSPRADGLVTQTPGLALGALSADCAPVLLSAKGMVGACHAGWRGAVGGILDSTVSLMREHGAKDIYAQVGPCISLESYEVGDDFRDTVLDLDPLAREHFHTHAGDWRDTERRPGRPWVGDGWHFDLPGYVVARLHRLEVSALDSGHCTYADPERYFSYRYNTHHGIGDYGRNISAIVLSA